MERQLKSDIEVEVAFRGITKELLPDFIFSFYSELQQEASYVCSKTGEELVNCIVNDGCTNCTVVKCILENHNLKSGRLCVLVHIKWPDLDYADGVRDDIYRKKLDLILKP